MKTLRILFSVAVVGFLLTTALSAQVDDSSVLHKVVKQNGVSFTGKIVSKDARELLLDSKEVGMVYIPTHEIREIIVVMPGDNSYKESLFATRYFLTTNGFPVKKGDNYVQWNLFGPDFQFGIADHFGVGIMTSWVGMPVVGTAKYSRSLGKNLHFGLGFLGGTGSWAFPEYGLVLPFGFITAGNRVNNINFSAGYGALFAERTDVTYKLVNTPTDWSTNSYTTESRTYNDSEGRFLWSVAGMFRLNSKFSFVFDSFIMMPGKEKTTVLLRDNFNPATNKTTYELVNEVVKQYPLIVLSPGIRFQASENSSFQFGFTGVHFEGEFVQVPIPMVQWFRRI